MATTVKMPNLGESVLEGTVGKWLVSVGQRVEREQGLVEILTDKTDSEIPSPVSGVVVKLVAAEGAAVAVGGDLLIIDETATGGTAVEKAPAKAAAPAAAAPAAAAPAAAAPAAAPAAAAPAASAGDAKASPATRKLAREMGVSISDVGGRGRGGVVTHDDVVRAGQLAPKTSAGQPAPSAVGQVAAPLAATGLGEAFKVLAGQGAFKVPPYNPSAGDKVVPFSRRRRIIADHMVYSKLTSPHVVTFAECDLHKTSVLRDQHKDALKKEGINLTFLAFVAAATAKALRENPSVNARVLEDSYVQFAEVNLGIAVETPEGLVVPVVRRADELRVRGLARAIDDVANRSRTGGLVPDDLAGKTFTISNPGKKGNLVGGAIISQPNVGILRIGEIKKRVVVVERDGEDTLAIHPVMYMALSYDHRIVDGVAANSFLYRINELLQNGEFDV